MVWAYLPMKTYVGDIKKNKKNKCCYNVDFRYCSWNIIHLR